ncbi:MAG: hypothetical protein HZB53_10870 [Chloroflexi bacterium]|nr:hypothetical protein [Chloroflexota bacterium]
MQVHLGGHLNWYEPQRRVWVELPAGGAMRLLAICAAVGVPPEEVAIAVVNGHAVDLERATATDADRVELYPPIGGGVA